MLSRATVGESRRAPGDGWGPMFVASLACHVLLALWIRDLPAASEIEVGRSGRGQGARPSLAQGRGPRGGPPPTPRPGGFQSVQNVDAPDRGEGGESTGAVAFVLLVSGAHRTLLQDSPTNASGPSQIQRIRTSVERSSWENRRATPNPRDDPFLASGEGRHRERRPVARVDARSGVRTAPGVSAGGGASTAVDARGALSASQHVGAEAESPGRGILAGAGRRSSVAARVARGRPPVDEGPAATLARYSGRVQDDTDAELLAGRLLQSVVDASDRRGPAPGSGRGGAGGGGEPGSGGGVGEGGRAAPYGPGTGAFPALDTSDARYERWYLEQRRRIQEALRYPRERALAMDQGTAVYRLTVARDGTLVGSPRRLRSSGFADFDAAAVAAIRRAAPFSALPTALAPGRRRVSIDLSIEFSNPMVR